MRRRLKHDFKHALLVGMSTGATALLAFAAGVLLVRYLPAEDYGFLSSAIAVLLVAQEFVGRGINDGLVRLGTRAAAGSDTRISNVFLAGFVLKMAFGLAIIVPCLFFPEEIERLLGINQLHKAFPPLLTAILGYGIWTYILAWLQARMSFTHLAAIQPVSSVLRLSCYLALIALVNFRWETVFWSIAAAFWVAILITGRPLWQEILGRPIQGAEFRKAFNDLWRCTRWGILSAVAFVALMRMDIFTLARYVKVTDVALYNAAWQVLIIMDLATTTIMTVMVPKVAHCVTYGENMEWAKRCVLLSLTSGLLSLPLLLLPQVYVPMILGTHYLPSIEIVKILYWGNLCGLLTFPLVGLLFARHAFHLNAAIQVILLVVSVPIYVYAAKNTGVVGVAWTTFGLRAANALLIVCCAGFLLRRSPC